MDQRYCNEFERWKYLGKKSLEPTLEYFSTLEDPDQNDFFVRKNCFEILCRVMKLFMQANVGKFMFCPVRMPKRVPV